MSPQDGAAPFPPAAGVNGQQPGEFVKPDPDIKQEPGLGGPLSGVPPAYPTDPRSVAAARASQALQKNYGNRATSSINAIQAGMSAQNPSHPAAMQQQQAPQQQQPLNGHQNPEQSYHQQIQQQVSQQAQQQMPQQQQQGQYAPQMPQTDGADGVDAEGVLMERDADGNMVEMGRLDIDRMLHSRILENAKSMEGGGFMVPLKEATKHTAPRKRNRARPAGQVDGDDDEDDEDAINSDLDDTDDDREDSEVDEEGLSHIMLCMYDKVQRVKNKWCVDKLWYSKSPLTWVWVFHRWLTRDLQEVHAEGRCPDRERQGVCLPQGYRRVRVVEGGRVLFFMTPAARPSGNALKFSVLVLIFRSAEGGFGVGGSPSALPIRLEADGAMYITLRDRHELHTYLPSMESRSFPLPCAVTFCSDVASPVLTRP